MHSSQDAIAVLRRTVAREPILNETAMKRALEGSHTALRCRQVPDSNPVCDRRRQLGGFRNKGRTAGKIAGTLVMACELRLAQKGVQFFCIHSALPAARAERYQEVARAVIFRVRSQHEVVPTWHLNCSH